MALTPKDWGTFQHYKDRAPPWIKLHRTLLDNLDYYRLSAEAGKALPLIWLLASEKEGRVPEAQELAFRLRIEEPLAVEILAELAECRFLVQFNAAGNAEQVATPSQRVAKLNGFGTRHISDHTKRIVWKRDKGRCCECRSDQNIEYDHKVPVSKGGTSENGNIQLLCRTCNRRKRAKMAAQAEQGAEQTLSSRTLEGEAEGETDRSYPSEDSLSSEEGMWQ
jgi:hypothetical protein